MRIRENLLLPPDHHSAHSASKHEQHCLFVFTSANTFIEEQVQWASMCI